MAGGLDPAWAARFPSLQRALIGLTFPSALTYIIIAGGELFTSNIMYTTLGLLRRNVNPLKSIAVCTSAFISNFLGCVLVAGFSVHLAGFLTTDPYKTYLLNAVHHKVQEPSFGLLLLKAIPANILVNIGVIMASAAEDIIGKIVGGYLPIMTFAIIGMEHCIANDFYIHAATFIEGGFPYGTWLWKTLIAVTLGNIIGVCLSLSATGMPTWPSTSWVRSTGSYPSSSAANLRPSRRSMLISKPVLDTITLLITLCLLLEAPPTSSILCKLSATTERNQKSFLLYPFCVF
jgi:formate/nitrite transporter